MRTTLLLEYALGEKRSFLWAVTPDSITSYQLPPREEVEAAARRVYGLLISRQPVSELNAAQQGKRETEADAQFKIQATDLSRMLLGPVAAQLGTKRLLIVAPGALQYVPFAVLPTARHQSARSDDAGKTSKSKLQPATLSGPLILKHEIVTLPSASVLAVLRRESSGRQPAAKHIAVLADPVFSEDDARVKLSLASGNSSGGRQGQQSETTLPTSTASLALKRAVKSVRGGGNASLRALTLQP